MAIPSPLNDLHRHAADYARQYGIQPRETQHHMDAATSRRIADAYERLQHSPNDPEVQEAYGALKREVLQQYQHLKDRGYTFTPYADESMTPDGVKVPYPDTHALTRDLLHNRHLHVYTGGAPPADHPLSEALPGQDPLGTYNVAFRAIHDAYGHARTGHDFSHDGEEKAWNQHLQMFSPVAQRALLTETRGQNAAFHYGEHGPTNTQDPSKAVFLPQKAGLLPAEFGVPNSQPQSKDSMSDPKVQKSLTAREAIKHLHEGLEKRVLEFEALCVGLRKAEALDKAQPVGYGNGAPSDSSGGNHFMGTGAAPVSPSPPASIAAPAGQGVLKQECTGTALCKCSSCSRVEKYAKGEKEMSQIDSLNPKKSDTGMRKVGCQKCGKPTVTIGPAHPVTCNHCSGKKLKKVATPMGPQGGPSAVPMAAPKIKLPGVKQPKAGGIPKMPKSPMGPAPTPPKAPGAAMKSEKPMAKAGLPPAQHAEMKRWGQHEQGQQARKLPHVRAKVGATMDSMLAGGQGLNPGQPLAITPIASNPLKPTAQAMPAPAGKVQTLVERAASRMPQGGVGALEAPTSGQRQPHQLPGQHLFGGPPATAPTASPAVQQHTQHLPSTKK